MTVAFSDVKILRDLMFPGAYPVPYTASSAPAVANLNGRTSANGSENVVNLSRWEDVNKMVLKEWFWRRKGVSATVNVLSVALYDLFGANGRYIHSLSPFFYIDGVLRFASTFPFSAPRVVRVC
jgi:hypothetical protein